jgi:mRNA interferase HigB
VRASVIVLGAHLASLAAPRIQCIRRPARAEWLHPTVTWGHSPLPMDHADRTSVGCVASHSEIVSPCMHVISRKMLRQFWELHLDSESALVRWFTIMQRQEFASFEALRATFPSADKVGDLIVFNIGGNKYRLIAAIHFNRRKVYIRHVLTHDDYGRGGWKT